MPSRARTGPNRLRRPLTAIVASMARRLGTDDGRGRHPGEPSSASLTGGTSLSPTRGTREWQQTARLIGVKASGAALAVLAATESITRAATDNASAELSLVLCLLALATTAPLIFLRPPGALVAISVASVVSVAPFHTLTVAGAIAELLATYRLSRGDARLLAAIVFVPFVVL